MTPSLIFFALSAVTATCATVIYVARLFFLDRAQARVRAELASDFEVKALRERVDTLGKTVSEHKAILATNASKGLRR